MLSRQPSSRISAIISDIDGTLVTDDKVLTDRARAAVAALQVQGLAFSIVSSRPPRAMRRFVGELDITSPIAAFNGGLLLSPEGLTLRWHQLESAAARRTIGIFAGHGVQPWVFTETDWFALDGSGPEVSRESAVVGFEPVVVREFGGLLDQAYKIVGVSRDPDILSRCEATTRNELPGQVTVGRSNPKHFDVTHPLANKGEAVHAIAASLGIQASEIAVIGDGENDIAMFEQAGLSIAMGNAGLDVQAAAQLVTASCNEDGFAKAMERLLGDIASDGTLSPQASP